MNINTILGWLPQNPLLGPPLPAWMNIFWLEKAKPEPPSEDFDILSGLVPKKIVTRVTVRKHLGRKVR